MIQKGEMNPYLAVIGFNKIESYQQFYCFLLGFRYVFYCNRKSQKVQIQK